MVSIVALVAPLQARHKHRAMLPPADIFHRQRRATRRTSQRGDDFIGGLIAESLLDRLDDVDRRFERALLIGDRSGRTGEGLAARGVPFDRLHPSQEEDQLDVAPGTCPLILWCGGLESVNDVPQALLRLRLALQPDGLLLACGVGDGALPRLRGALRQAPNVAGTPFAARMMPQLSLSSLGELAQRAGFTLPVVDVDSIRLRYKSAQAVVVDLRATALNAVLAGVVPTLSRREWAAVEAGFLADADAAGRVEEELRLIHLSGWAPHPSQPKAAQRGSGKVSLAAALRPSGQPKTR